MWRGLCLREVMNMRRPPCLLTVLLIAYRYQAQSKQTEGYIAELWQAVIDGCYSRRVRTTYGGHSRILNILSVRSQRKKDRKQHKDGNNKAKRKRQHDARYAPTKRMRCFCCSKYAKVINAGGIYACKYTLSYSK